MPSTCACGNGQLPSCCRWIIRTAAGKDGKPACTATVTWRCVWHKFTVIKGLIEGKARADVKSFNIAFLEVGSGGEGRGRRRAAGTTSRGWASSKLAAWRFSLSFGRLLGASPNLLKRPSWGRHFVVFFNALGASTHRSPKKKTKEHVTIALCDRAGSCTVRGFVFFSFFLRCIIIYAVRYLPRSLRQTTYVFPYVLVHKAAFDRTPFCVRLPPHNAFPRE